MLDQKPQVGEQPSAPRRDSQDNGDRSRTNLETTSSHVFDNAWTRAGIGALDAMRAPASGAHDLLPNGDVLLNGLAQAADSGGVKRIAGKSVDAPSAKSEDDLMLQANRMSMIQFPNAADSRYRDLSRKEILATDGKHPKLTGEEIADLGGKRQFPDDVDAFYRMLASKDILAGDGKHPKLTTEERLGLDAKRQFPSYFPDDVRYRELFMRHGLSQDGTHAKLNFEEAAELEAKLKFPSRHDAYFRELERKRILSTDGQHPKLGEEETKELRQRNIRTQQEIAPGMRDLMQ